MVVDDSLHSASWCDCVLLGSVCREFELGRQSSWRLRCNLVGVVNAVDDTALVAVLCLCVYWVVCGVQARPSSNWQSSAIRTLCLC